MAEVVKAVKRVTDIMGEISAASAEQSSGIEEINLAVTQMDAGTQQNAARWSSKRLLPRSRWTIRRMRAETTGREVSTRVM